MMESTRLEKQAVTALAIIFVLRMLGLFMILPVFPVYAVQLHHANPLLIGVALGAYGLTQALLQIPFGFASDRFGRRPVIVLGLLLFGVGSVIAACSESIYGIIIGRSLQGASAIGCVIMALLSDLTREVVRQRAMAIIGVSIGLSFAFSFVLGSLLSEHIGMPGIFGMTAILALLAIFILIVWVPTPEQCQAEVRSHFASAKRTDGCNNARLGSAIPVLSDIPKVFCMSELRALNIGVLILHASLVALFLKIPIAVHSVGFDSAQAWQFYLPVFLCSCLAMMPGLVILGKKAYVKYRVVLPLCLLAISEFGIFHFFHSLVGIAISLGLFFTAFNTLEATLPSLVVQRAPLENRGTALGIYSTAQFFGIFAGGVIGGWLDTYYGMVAILVFCIVLAMVWMLFEIATRNDSSRRKFKCQEGLIR